LRSRSSSAACDRESFNRKLATGIAKLAPPEFSFKQGQIGDLPLYNQNNDGNQVPRSND
jgi:chromate reductase